MINILFTCVGRRNNLINYFKDAIKGKGQIFAADMTLSAPAMGDADVALLVPSIYDDTYITSLKDIIKKHNISAVVSLNDLELPIISKHKTELEATGVKVIVSSEDVIDIAFDKFKTFNFITSIGLSSPKTYISLIDAKKALAEKSVSFPLIIKPRWGSGSIGIDIIDDMEELELAFKLQQLKLKKSILYTASQNDLVNAILIQEKLDGTEYGLDILNDFEGNYIGTFAREKLSMRYGETDKAVSVIDSRLEELGKTISQNLKHIGHLDCDVFMAKDDLYLIDLNPRFGGGYPFSQEAGANIAAMYIEWINNSNDISQYNNYEAGLFISKYGKIINLSKRQLVNSTP